MGEPAIVVGDRKELTYLLSQAAELEHGLMCEYLYAAFSLKSRAGPGLRADQLDSVGRWRKVILGIAAEEMLHWAMVQNLLAAVGSAPYVSRPHMPAQARGYPPGVQVRLLPFGEVALQHFVYLEDPVGLFRAQAAPVKSSRWRWLVRVRSRGLPVHQASSRIRLTAAAAALCSRRVLSRPR